MKKFQDKKENINKNFFATIFISNVLAAFVPTAGVFATAHTAPSGEAYTAQKDTLQVTIEPICSFGYKWPEVTGATIDVDGVDHADGSTDIDLTHTEVDGVWSTASEATTIVTGKKGYADTLAGYMMNETYTENFGQTILSVYCNNEDGYNITYTATDLAEQSGGSGVISLGNSIAGTASNWSFKVAADTASTQRGSVATGHDVWTADKTGTVAELEDNITANEGDKYTVTYGVSVDNELPAGTYEGTITYILNQLPTNKSRDVDMDENINDEPEKVEEEPKEKSSESEPEVKKSVDDGTAEKINDLEQKVNDLSNQLNSLSSPSYTTINNYNSYGGDTIISNSTPTSTPTETPVSTTPNPSATGTDATEGLTSAKGVSSKSGSGTKEVESSNNTGLIIALVALGATATVATGAYFYMKDKEE